MAALTAARNTVRQGDNSTIDLWAIPVKAATKIYQGALVVVDAGYAAPGRTATGLLVAGVAIALADNTGGAAGAITATARRGTFKFNNSAAADLIAQTEVGTICYIVDDQTVAKVATGRSKAGLVVQVDSDGVWVEVGIYGQAI